MFGGTNDFWHHSTALGNVTDSSTNTFCGALNYVLDYLQTNQPNAKILFVFPMHQYFSGNSDSHDFGYGTLKDFRNKAKEVCEYRGVYMLDLYSCSGTCVSINETQRDLYTIDGIHPNANGHSLIADIIFNAINYMIWVNLTKADYSWLKDWILQAIQPGETPGIFFSQQKLILVN